VHFVEPIRKTPRDLRVPPHLADYARDAASFSWEVARGKLALDLHAGDVFCCTADPRWVTGTSYGMIAPLVRGVTMVVDEGTSTLSAGTGCSRTSA
jgi:hypothetical protein